MRTTRFYLVLGLAMLSTSCGGGQPGSAAKSPSSVNASEVIEGKWQTKRSESKWDYPIQMYEFAKDGTMTLTCIGAKDPIQGKYTFVNEYTIEIEYQPTEEGRKAYANAFNEYKKQLKATITPEGVKVDGQALATLQQMIGRLTDELPTKEKLTVNMRSIQASTTDADKSKEGSKSELLEMQLTNEKGHPAAFRKLAADGAKE